MPRLRCLLSCLCLLNCCFVSFAAGEEQWSRFRGPNGTGVSDCKGLPTQWKEGDYEWTITLPGKGHSSPVIWNDYLFVTSSLNNGERIVHCFDAFTGQPRWSDTIQMGERHLHKKNSYASGTPATDGERVYVPFSDQEKYTLTAWTMDGKRLWTKDLGKCSVDHGAGCSPMVYGGLVYLHNDPDGEPGTLWALDARTGDVKWSHQKPSGRACYSTPIISNLGGRDQLITANDIQGVVGVDPHTGKQLWASGRLPERTVGSPVIGQGYCLISCGKGGRGVTMEFVNIGDETVQTAGKGSDSKVEKVERKQGIPYVPTPVIYGDYAYLWNDDGIVCCVDLKGDLTQNVWRQRIGGNFSGSPILVDGKIYCISEDGEVAVIDASPQFKLYGKSPLGDSSHATPAVANDRLYLRGFQKLVCLKAKPGQTAATE